jgi:hypothetical protein
MAWLADHLPVFSNAGEGIVRQIGHNVRGHGAYLLGHSDPRAFWYYFPVLLTIKLTPTLLLAPLVLAVVGRRSLLSWATVATLLLLLFSLNCRVQIGVRLVLPLVTLAIVGLAGAAASAWQAQPTVFRRRLLAGAAALGVASSAAAAVRVWPNELCYVNAYWGGTRRGYQIVSESNYDWGQGLPELAAWQRKKDVDNLDIWYFGSDPSLKSLPMRHLPLQCMEFAGPEQIADQVRGRYLAVGTTILYGKEGETLGWRQGQAFLKTRKPVARTTTFLIYDFTREPDGHASRSP